MLKYNTIYLKKVRNILLKRQGLKYTVPEYDSVTWQLAILSIFQFIGTNSLQEVISF
jgi:hypothetical protein